MKNKFYKHLFFQNWGFILIFLLAAGILQPFITSAESLDTKLAQVSCSITANQQSLVTVFGEIEKQTNIHIVCVDRTGLLEKKVSLYAPNSNLENVMNILSRQLSFSFVTQNGQIIVRYKPVTEQVKPREIQGKVTDEKGLPLPGVSVIIKGTVKGTITDPSGNFALQANEGDVLQFSFLGYIAQELPIGKDKTYGIVLKEDPKGLAEVVVTALGIKKEKKAIGYAVQEVKGETMEKAREPNVVSSLTGKVAGLTVYNPTTTYESPTITLRGQAPLIVIDGIATQNDTWNLSADDIDNITVLKGAAASLLYGGIGAYGAVQITTKKGKAGANGVEVAVNLTGQVQAGVLNQPKTQNDYGMGWDGQYAYVDGAGGGLYDNYGYVWGPKLNQKDPSTASGYIEVPQYNSPYNPNQTYTVTEDGNTVDSHYKPIPLITRGANNLSEFLNNELLSTANISIAGKSDKSDFRISATQLYQKGQVPNTKINATTLSLAGDTKLSDKVKVDANLSYNRQYTPNYPIAGYGPTNYYYNILLWMGPDVNINDLKNYWQPGKVGTQQFTYNYTWYNNPWFLANEYLNGYTDNVVIGQASLSYDISKTLNLLVRSGGTATGSTSTTQTPYSFINYGTSAAPQGQFSIGNTNFLRVVSDAILTYNKSFLKDFNITARAGASDRYESTTSLSSSTSAGLQVPGVYNLSNSNSPVTSTNSLAETEVKSLYGSADLSYKGMAYLNVSGRNDWTSHLQPPNNSFFYPSASLSLIVSEMFKLPEFISYLKLRGAYSDIYNDKGISPYQTLPVYNSGTRWNGTPSLNQPGTIYSPNITSNRTRGPEYGLEANFLNNRIGIDATYFTYLDDHYVENVPISEASGYTSLVVNSDVYNRKGLEIVLNGTPIKTKDFRWDVSANYANVRNYVRSLGGPQERGFIKVGDRVNVDWEDNGYNYVGYAWQRSPSGQIVYQNGMPQYINQDVVMGVTDPDWTFGITNHFTYKNFSFSFSLDGRVGGVLFDALEYQLYEGGKAIQTDNHYRDEAYAGKSTYIGKGVNVTSGSVTYDFQGKVVSDTRKFAPNTTPVNYVDWIFAYYVNGIDQSDLYKRTFVKLREAILTYTLPSSMLGKTFIKSASVSLVGRNLFLFTKVPDVDPDAFYGSSTNLGDPSYRNIGLNLNLKF